MSEARHRKLQEQKVESEQRGRVLDERYRDALARLEQLSRERDELRVEVAGLQRNVDELSAELSDVRTASADEREQQTRQLEENEARIAALQDRSSRTLRRLQKVSDGLKRYYGQELWRMRAELAIQRRESRGREHHLNRRIAELEGFVGDRYAQAEMDAQRGRIETALEEEIASRRVRTARLPDRLVISVAADVLFDDDGSELSASGRALLTNISPVVAVHPGFDVRIIARSDASPSRWRRASARATTVAAWISDHGGVRPERVTASAAGADDAEVERAPSLDFVLTPPRRPVPFTHAAR